MPGYELVGAEELAEIQDVFQHGGVLFRHGFDAMRQNCYKVKEFESAFAQAMGAKHALAVSSGTAALRVALAALDIGPGDEVITQCFTFVATVEAIIESGAAPVCAEIDDTLNLDPEDLKRKITARTRAVIAVHMLGTPARLSEISAICREHGIPLIEDTAWGCGGRLQGHALGTWGRIGTYSFDFAKTMTTGEGGMLVFNEEADWRRAMAWHDHGHENNPAVPRWEDTRLSSGFNFRMMELQGAVGLAQLKKLPRVIEAQRSNKENIWRALSALPSIELRAEPAGAEETADALIFLATSRRAALAAREALVSAGYSTKILPEAYTWHFAATWTHMPELAAAHANALEEAFPKSTALLQRAVSIPINVMMRAEAPAAIAKALSGVL